MRELQSRQVVGEGGLLHGARPAERRVQTRPPPAHTPVPAAENERVKYIVLITHVRVITLKTARNSELFIFYYDNWVKVP